MTSVSPKLYSIIIGYYIATIKRVSF
jgi:hypothetical protein